MCASFRKIELSVKPIIFLLQIYFGCTRRGSDYDNDIVMGKALREDKALNTFYFEKMQ